MSSVVNDDAPGWAIRLEAKVDVALGRQDAHEGDIKELKSQVRALELKPTVSPMGLATSLGLSITALGGFIALLDRITA